MPFLYGNDLLFKILSNFYNFYEGDYQARCMFKYPFQPRFTFKFDAVVRCGC